VSKPGIDELLIASALDADLLEHLREHPDDVLDGYDLTLEQREIIRSPDNRLLPLLGAALARRSVSQPAPEIAESAPHAVLQGKALPEVGLALTIVPCATGDSYSYAVWVNPLPEGTDPSSLPPPPGATLPGEPLSPLYAVVRLSPMMLQGGAQVALWASLTQSTNVEAPPAASLDSTSDAIQAAAAAVRAASHETRYDKLIELARVVQGGSRS
jgi:hypothetical protein